MVKIPLNKFNYLLHPCLTVLITCKNKETNKTNIITVAWITPVSLNPPILVLSIKPTRFSYKIIKEAREFVVNIPSYNLMKQALFCGSVSGEKVDKFKEAGLRIEKSEKVETPRIKECIAYIECKIREVIKAGDHDLFLADVLLAEAQEKYLTNEGLYNLKVFRPLLHVGKDYFVTVSTVGKET